MEDLWFTAEDGTRLHGICAHVPTEKTPLVCLPGLTRSTRDFAPVFDLVKDRTVIAFDFRGRGKSGRADPLTYRPDIEMADTITFLDHLRVGRFAVLGTSRGGIVGMLIAASHKQRLAGLMLNDIGPEIVPAGLKRIVGYVSKNVVFPNWDAAAQALAWSSVGFELVTHAEWVVAAHMIFAERDGAPVNDHDPLLSINLPSAEQIDAEGVKDLWALVPQLADMPLALLRGAGSDLLSRETVLRFASEMPTLQTTEVKGRGHVPFLTEAESKRAILDWLNLT